MTIDSSAYYNDLDGSLAHGWAMLQRGARDRRSHFHTLTVATLDTDGNPDARVMVLREADRGNGRLRFHTDARSHKAKMIGAGAAVTVLAYDPGAHVQLRLRGTATIDTNSAERQAAWERTSLYGRRCYLGDIGPGAPTDQPTSGLSADLEGVEPTADRTAPGRANFALLWIKITSIEWLFLAHQGHRRARFEASPTGWVGRWLIP
jgi:pyridoxamine 5'-phosphate oxidase